MFHQRSAALVLLAGLCWGCVQQAELPREAYAATDLTVRDAPSVDAGVVARLPRGSTVHVGSCAEGWCGVGRGEVRGYTEQAHLSDSIPPEVTSAQQDQRAGRGYVNAYGEWVPSPQFTADGQPPAGASAQCRDGSYSFSQTRRGTCSWHGGVARWLPRAESIRR